MISQLVLDQLIALGRSNTPSTPPALREPERAWRLLMVGDEPWRRAARQLSDVDLRSLMRGLVMFSRATGWSGGSVSPMTPVYEEFLSRAPRDEPEVTKWIVDNRVNDYEPFGTVVHGGARSQSEYLAYKALRARKRAPGLARDAERQDRDGAAKATRATTRLLAAVKRGDVAAVHALVDSGADVHAATQDGRSLLDVARAANRPQMIDLLHELGLSEEDSDATSV